MNVRWLPVVPLSVLAAACAPPLPPPVVAGRASCDGAAIRDELRGLDFRRALRRDAAEPASTAALVAEARAIVAEDRAARCAQGPSAACEELNALATDLETAYAAARKTLAELGPPARVLADIRAHARDGCGHGERTERCAAADQLRAAVGSTVRGRVERLEGLTLPAGSDLQPALVRARDAAKEFERSLAFLVTVDRAVRERLPAPDDDVPGRCVASWATTWSAASRPNPRAITVSIDVSPGASWAHLASEAARLAGQPAGTNWTGSGVVIAGRGASGDAPVGMTNRHVVEGGIRFRLRDGDGEDLGDAVPVFVDAEYDLAVLAPTSRLARTGAALSREAVADLAAVVAVGFPALGGRPSYQITTGKVSNRDVTDAHGGRAVHLIQHTAAIDPGNSGGPLLDDRGALLGVNTLKAMTRESVGFAIPLPAVTETAARVYWSGYQAAPPPTDPSLARAHLEAACLDVLAGGQGDSAATTPLRFDEAVLGELGGRSLRLPPSILAPVVRNERGVTSLASLGLMLALGESPGETCAGASGGSAAEPSLLVQGENGPMTLTFRWSRGSYRLIALKETP